MPIGACQGFRLKRFASGKLLRDDASTKSESPEIALLDGGQRAENVGAVVEAHVERTPPCRVEHELAGNEAPRRLLRNNSSQTGKRLKHTGHSAAPIQISYSLVWRTWCMQSKASTSPRGSRDFAMDAVMILEFVVNAALIIVALLLVASAIWGSR